MWGSGFPGSFFIDKGWRSSRIPSTPQEVFSKKRFLFDFGEHIINFGCVGNLFLFFLMERRL